MDISNLVSNVGKTLKTNAPEILTALGISGVVTTSYLSAKGSFVAADYIGREQVFLSRALSNKEKVKLVWKYYIPAGISGAVTIACVVLSHKASGNRTAAAVAAYSLTERAFSEYKEKVVEEIGKGKERKIRDEVVQDHVSKAPQKEIEVITITGTVLCYEKYTGRYFRSDMESLRKAQNDLNGILISQIFAALDEFYDLVGLPYTSNSTFLGWDSDRFLELEFSTVISEAGEPCLAFEYNYVKPIRGM